MKTKIIIATGVFSIFTLQSAFGQGALTPPGAPAPTMKSLDQIEPRTPIASLPYFINVPGSYYLTTNLTGVASQYGVAVLADNVTLDLNGFALIGVNNSFSGVAIFGVKNVCVRNGTIRGWGNYGINGLSNERFERLFLTDNASGGLGVFDNALVFDCTAIQNGGGISVGNGGTVRDCVAAANSGYGFSTGNGCTMIGCTATTNSGTGFSVGAGNTVKDCTANSNTGHGISTGDGCTVNGCSSSFNGSDGIHTGSACTVRGCTVRSDGSNEIYVERKCLVIENLCDRGNNNNPGSACIRANGDRNRVDANHLVGVGNGFTYYVGGTNLVIRNTVDGVGFEGAGTINGPGILPGSGVDGLGTITNNNPWANIKFTP